MKTEDLEEIKKVISENTKVIFTKAELIAEIIDYQ